jgi:polysaccharide transporter, PST family
MRSHKLKGKKTVLLKNTVMLYILKFSSYFFSFVTVPYQTRVLGPEYFGKLGFALAFMVYFQLLIDFGFTLSATEDVSKNRHNINKLSKVVISVTTVKFFLSLLAFIILIAICIFIPKFRADIFLYILCFFAVSVNSFLPDFLYRGLENMSLITIRTVLVKFFFTVMVFLLLKEKEDFYIIPMLMLLGNLGAVLAVYIHAFRRVGIKVVRVNFIDIWRDFKRSSLFFYSRIATTVYGATNSVLLGSLYPTGTNIVGLYIASDKLVNTARSCFSPIADSLYPYMVKNRDFKVIRKTLFIIMPPVFVGCVLIGIYAEEFCALLLGEEFRSAGAILRILMPIIIITPAVYILGFPVMTPMGLSKQCNLSTVFASCFHVVALGIMFFTGNFNVVNLCYATCLTELSLLLYRSIVIWYHRNSFIIKNEG